MSRSYKKVPIGGYVGGSEKKDKTTANKRFRKMNKLKLDEFWDEEFFDNVREVANTYNFRKDGKHWFGTPLLGSAAWTTDWTHEDIKKFMRK